MKKLIFLLSFILLITSIKAQVYVEVWETSGTFWQKKLIPYVAGVTPTVTKLSLGLDRVNNTNDIEKPISSAVLAALNTKANIGSGGTGGTFTGIFKGSNTNTLIFEPENYNPALKQGRFTISNGYFPDVNLPATSRGNVVFNLGYNTNPGGGLEIEGEPGFRLGLEANYWLGRRLFEFHGITPEITLLDGRRIRTGSWYGSPITGQGSFNAQVEQYNNKLVDDINHDWESKGVYDKNVRVTYNPKPGGQSSIVFNGRLANPYPNQNTFSHSQLEIVATGHLTGLYSTVPFYFSKSITVNGSVSVKSPNGTTWRISVSDAGVISAVPGTPLGVKRKKK